jgi:CubicO group peptidase (beta-lactamase class C family)
MSDSQENVPSPASDVPPDLQSLVPIQPQMIPAAVEQLDTIIDTVMTRTGVPGLAAAVVYDGELLYAKGFGVRDITTRVPVDPEGATVFQLASVSKALSSTVVAGAVGRGAVKWTDPVVGHLSSFALADPYVTQHVTLADLFSHLSGLPDHAGDLLEDLGYDQGYILDRLRLEPLAPFRTVWDYTNFGLTAAAVATAAAAGRSWADLADDILFGPVGMRASSFRHSDFLGREDRAAMHVREGNGMPIGVPESVINYFLDHVQAGSAQQDWLTLYGQVFARQYVNHSVLAGQKPPANPIPPRPETFYTGTYDNSYYRPIRITAEGGSLHLLIGPAPDDYPLQHWSGDLFAFFPTGENGVGITAATFNAGPGSTRAQSVTLEFYDTTGLGTFVRP